MPGGIKRNRVALPKGRALNGSEIQPEDVINGGWLRADLEVMDRRFTDRLTQAFRAGTENPKAATATYDLTKRR